MDVLFSKLFDVFSLEYMFTVIIASYLMIKLIDVLNGDGVVPTWMKRTVTCVIGSVSFVVFKIYTDLTFQCLLASFFASVFVYDTAIKVLIRKFNIDYRK